MNAAEIPVLQWIVQLGSFGLVAWMFYYTFTKTIPQFLATIDKMATQFSTTVDNTVKQFSAQLDRQREENRADRLSERQSTCSLQSEIRTLTQTVVDHDRDMRRAHSDEYQHLIERVLREHKLLPVAA